MNLALRCHTLTLNQVMMKYYPLFFIVCIAVSGCTPLIDGTKRTAEDANAALISTGERIHSYLSYHPTQTPEPPPLQPRYCYKVLTDILCYSQPYPPAERHLVGWQGEAPEVSPERLAPSAREMPSALPTTTETKPILVGDIPPVKDGGSNIKINEPAHHSLY